MKIAVDAFPLTLQNPTGISNYVAQLMKALLEADKENDYSLYARSPFAFGPASGTNCTIASAAGAPPFSSSFRNTLWLFTSGVLRMRRESEELFFGTRQMLPPGLSGMARVLIVYDLVWHYYPETMSRYNALVLRLLGRRSIMNAHRIISISDSTTEDIVKVTGYPREKITTIYPSADSYGPLDRNEAAEYIARKYGVSRRYALCVGTIEPRKNIKTLLRAFAGLKDKGYQLLVCGASGWKSSPVHDEYRRLGLAEDTVKFLGYVPEEDMNRLYSGARLFAFPSIYEGFGMPVLEAMASGTPCILSNTLKSQIMQGASILLDPVDVSSWMESIDAVFSDDARQGEMRRQGIECSSRLTWPQAAAKTLGVFRAAMRDVRLDML